MDAINTSIKDAMGYKSKSAIWSNITLLQTFHHPTRVNIDSIKDIPGSLNKRKHFQSKEIIICEIGDTYSLACIYPFYV